MSLHANWNYVLEDLALLAGLSKNSYDVYESITQRHPNAKLVVRCAACSGNFGLLVRNIQNHYFRQNAQPSINCTCPHCNSNVNQHSMTYVNATNS